MKRMVEVTKGPDTTGVERGRAAEGVNTDLSALRMGPDLMNLEGPTPFRHTPASIEQKWGQRTFDTGVTIQGRKAGGAA